MTQGPIGLPPELPSLKPRVPPPPPPPPPAGSTVPKIPAIRMEPLGEEGFMIPTPTRPEARSLEELVLEAKRLGASDIHLGVGEPPRFRVRGRMLYSEYVPTTMATFYRWWQEVLPVENLQLYERTKELDTAIMYPGMARLRVNLFFTILGPAAVLRLINLEIPSLEELSLPDVLKTISEAQKGLVLITGPTGSGKSTTLAAMIRYINENFAKHIISIEDPIEYVHTSIRSLVRQREVGAHTLEFEAALRASLREDPDVILIGEMRDRITVDTALKAAQTGHLVFGTLHTNSAVSTIERLLNIYTPSEQNTMRTQIAESLVAVVAQSLVRTSDRKRRAVHEIMINTDAARDYIKNNQVDELDQLIPQCKFDGMQTMNQALFQLVQEGITDEETTLEASPRAHELKQLFRGKMDNTRMI
ncbi:type IV pilus twitching motility protein PilT [Anthocerotibacter panamensis]|uniref:type IV pilus twitching motility protein PilT n=1 Tax=Anthocerotibacter panamensis TaxID=2857077 RepID=UPI001FD923DC|nr:type IV pilus twitching motility protein PilT [Anthocerotibacter panamensis]